MDRLAVVRLDDDDKAAPRQARNGPACRAARQCMKPARERREEVRDPVLADVRHPCGQAIDVNDDDGEGARGRIARGQPAPQARKARDAGKRIMIEAPCALLRGDLVLRPHPIYETNRAELHDVSVVELTTRTDPLAVDPERARTGR